MDLICWQGARQVIPLHIAKLSLFVQHVKREVAHIFLLDYPISDTIAQAKLHGNKRVLNLRNDYSRRVVDVGGRVGFDLEARD